MIPEGILALFAAMLCSLRLGDGGSFPKPLSREEEQRCLTLAARGDLEARNVLIERNLRLVAHIMKKYYAQSADQLGWTLDELLERTLAAMKTFYE